MTTTDNTDQVEAAAESCRFAATAIRMTAHFTLNMCVHNIDLFAALYHHYTFCTLSIYHITTTSTDFFLPIEIRSDVD